MALCEPHSARGVSVPAEIIVAGTPMCNSCFAGGHVSIEELAGDTGGATSQAYRSYYAANREKVLATHRKLREARRFAECATRLTPEGDFA